MVSKMKFVQSIQNDFGSNVRPFFPFLTTLVNPPTFVVTEGSPHALASAITMPMHSALDGRIKKLDVLYNSIRRLFC